MSLTAVIPAHNDGDSLNHLLAQIGRSEIFAEVIVVDDASDPPLAPTLVTDSATRLRVVRQNTQSGAGQARNLAFDLVQTDYLLCLDADDLITPELTCLWRDIQNRINRAENFDFCLFRHCDTRVAHRGGWGQTSQDDTLWMAAGAHASTLTSACETARHILAETSNFPWNKIYRTDFLAAHALRCSPIPVHNDVALHWRSMIHAERVWTSNRICVVHGVSEQGTRLTNRRGRDRLVVFDALAEVQPDIEASGPWALPWLRFVTGLFDWIQDRLAPEAQDSFRKRRQSFLHEAAPAPVFQAIAQRHPHLAARILRQMDTTC